MKDPVIILETHRKKIVEIIGRLNKFFGPQKHETEPEEIGKKYDAVVDKLDSIQDTDDICAYYGTKVGTIARPHVKGERNEHFLQIDDDKKIDTFKGISFQEIDPKGNGKSTYYPARFADFKCYDTDRDIYGIAWLFAPDAKYNASYITGKLKANVTRPQAVDFYGLWYDGRFYGNFKSQSNNFIGGTDLSVIHPLSGGTSYGPIIP